MRALVQRIDWIRTIGGLAVLALQGMFWIAIVRILSWPSY